MTIPASCCTCASVLSLEEEAYGLKTEKPIKHRNLPCCGRQVCALCIEKNPRFESYCEYGEQCVVIETDSSLGPFCQSTRLPPLSHSRDEKADSQAVEDEPPPYSTLSPIPQHTPPPAPRPRHATLSMSQDRPAPPLPPPAYEVRDEPLQGGQRPPTPPYPTSEDVIHYLSPDDSIQSISLAYRVPTHILKSHNGIHSDYLLSARRKISIPAAFYQGPSLSPHPLDNPEEQERKSKIRKLMVKCKVAEYKVAVIYLEEAGWNLEKAEAKVEEDDNWERAHPIHGSGTSDCLPASPFPRRLRLAEPLSPRRIANLLN